MTSLPSPLICLSVIAQYLSLMNLQRHYEWRGCTNTLSVAADPKEGSSEEDNGRHRRYHSKNG
jgi:hypothetical protein